MAKIGINLSTGSLQKKEMIIGIDLGTARAVAAFVHPETNDPVILKEFDGSFEVPAIIYAAGPLQVNVGGAANPTMSAENTLAIRWPNLLLGKSLAELMKHEFYCPDVHDHIAEQPLRFPLGERSYAAVELVAVIIKEIKRRAEHILKTPVTKAVVTVPALFTATQRQAAIDAGKLAGLQVLRILNEPTAASLAYGGYIGRDQKMLVYNLGIGMCEVSVVEYTAGGVKVLASRGTSSFGTGDFDQIIIDRLLQQNNLGSSGQMLDASLKQEIVSFAERARIHLNTNDLFEGGTGHLHLALRKDEFESAIRPYLDESVMLCNMALGDAGIPVNAIESVLMIGHFSDIPAVRKTLASFAGQEPQSQVHPADLVGLGAARLSGALANKKNDLVLNEILANDLGIQNLNGGWDLLFPRASLLPAFATRHLTTGQDNQQSLTFPVFQGQGEDMEKHAQIMEIRLPALPKMPAAFPDIEVVFSLDADGILGVSAKETKSGLEQQVEIRPLHHVAASDVELLLLDHLYPDPTDLKQKKAVQAESMAERIVTTGRRFLQHHGPVLTKDEILTVEKSIENLMAVIVFSNGDITNNKINELELVLESIAARLAEITVAAGSNDSK